MYANAIVRIKKLAYNVLHSAILGLYVNQMAWFISMLPSFTLETTWYIGENTELLIHLLTVLPLA